MPNSSFLALAQITFTVKTTIITVCVVKRVWNALVVRCYGMELKLVRGVKSE